MLWLPQPFWSAAALLPLSRLTGSPSRPVEPIVPHEGQKVR